MFRAAIGHSVTKSIFLLTLLLAGRCFALDGAVVGVADGDTITVLDSSNVQHKIRLAQIDAPEKNQPWGARSKQALSDLVYAKRVTVSVSDHDRYGREVGTVFIDGIDVCREQVKQGNAWVYVAYAKDAGLYDLERHAKAIKTGLWSDENAVAPWLWRKEVGKK